MFEAITEAFITIRAAMGWAPDNVVGALILALAAALGLAVHRGVTWLLRRLARRHQFAMTFIAQSRRLTLVALIIATVLIALPATPFDSDTKTLLAKVLALGTVVVVGWAVIVAANIAANIYLLRFRVDVADNLLARKHVTQVRVLMRVVDTLLILVTAGAALMTFESVRQYGVSLFASAGVAGIIAGLAARPLLSNLLAGIQLAMTQPIRIDDAVVVENEWGQVEEITSTYVVIRLWDWRRLVVPLTYFIEKPFQNWTREGSAIIGTILLHLDYTAPIDRIRMKARELAQQSKLWDGKVVNVQVTDATEKTIEVRILLSAASASTAWDLRCEVREKLIDFLQREYPEALPHRRQQIMEGNRPASERQRPVMQERSARSA